LKTGQDGAAAPGGSGCDTGINSVLRCTMLETKNEHFQIASRRLSASEHRSLGMLTPAFAATASGRHGAPRPLGQAMLRGLRCRCPACGEGRLFGRYLKPVASCSACGEDFTAQSADDFPPYIVILLLGHIIVPMGISIDTHFRPPLWMYAVFGTALIVLLVMLMLQPVKGGVIAYQWAHRMHGFADTVPPAA
jgi:uncharacterized protein (DUF983 family)